MCASTLVTVASSGRIEESGGQAYGNFSDAAGSQRKDFHNLKIGGDLRLVLVFGGGGVDLNHGASARGHDS